MVRTIGLRWVGAALLALATAAGAAPAAQAGSRVGIALLPPMPATSAPFGAVPGPALPGAFPGIATPGPFAQTTPPSGTFFTAPMAVPLVVPDAGHAGGR